MVNTRSAMDIDIFTLPKAWGAMAAVDTISGVQGAFVNLSRTDETMTAAYIIRHAKLVMGKETYFPAANASEFEPRPDFPLLTDDASCLDEAQGSQRVLGNGLFLISQLAARPEPLTIDFSRPICGLLLTFQNVGDAEGFGRWTAGRQAVLTFQLPSQSCCDLALELRASPFGASGRVPRQRVALEIDGKAAGQWDLTNGDDAILRAVVPSFSNKKGPQLVLSLPDAISPAELGGSTDKRTLGLAMHTLTLNWLPKW
jgi:hypothetical protein